MGFVKPNHGVRRSGKGIGRQKEVEYGLLRDEPSTVEEPGIVSEQDSTGITADPAN